MQVLVFNAGSASLKFDLIHVEQHQASASQGRKLVSCSIEGVGSKQPVLSRFEGKDVKDQQTVEASNYENAATTALSWLLSSGTISSFDEIDLVGHRVVHGANRFLTPTQTTNEVTQAIRELDALAPLHNQPAAEVIESSRRVLGSTRMLAVFDTAFHRNMPKAAYTYALPADLIERHGIRRYGFHGLSHRYLFERYIEITGRSAEQASVITLHLESGASVCALRNGESVETSMGFTPLEGLVMGKRCGDIDPALVGVLARAEHLTLDEVEDVLNKKSGLFGLSQISHDTRDLVQHLECENVRLALDVFCHRIKKYLGAYLAVLNGAEAIIFGGGIGENTPWVRQQVCSGMEWFGLHLDTTKNDKLINWEGRITMDDSRRRFGLSPRKRRSA